jgi:hypothetical protein
MTIGGGRRWGKGGGRPGGVNGCGGTGGGLPRGVNGCGGTGGGWLGESPSLVLVINDTKLLMPSAKCFELGISNTCDEGVCGKEWWPQDHKEMVHGHEMMIMVVMYIIWWT